MSAHGFLSRREIINHRKITANTAKEGITQDLKNKIEDNTLKPAIDWTQPQMENIHPDNFTTNFTDTLKNKLEGIEEGATQNTGNSVLDWTVDQGSTVINSTNYTGSQWTTTTTGSDIYYNTGNGKVGIGTSDPLAILHCKANSYAIFSRADSAVTGYSGIRLGEPLGANDMRRCAVIESFNANAFGADLRFKTCQTPSAAVERMRISDTGRVLIGGGFNPSAKLEIRQSGLTSSDGITLSWEPPGGALYLAWRIYMATNFDLYFELNGSLKGYIDESSITTNGKMNFTGQHRCILNKNLDETSKGLIVSSTGKYININNSLNTNINESLPICNITNTDNDKKVFGVISDKEDTNSNRNYSSGNFVSCYEKTNKNEQRMFINSVGEGAIWVCNKNGNVENGDYISSSSVAGYGMKQTLNEDFLTRYTVAKITCDCHFSLTKIVKQKLKVINQSDSSGNAYTDIDYDTNGDVQYEDDLDANGSQQMIFPFETRFLQADATQITEAEYNSKLGTSEEVYIACFVGCTYHCG